MNLIGSPVILANNHILKPASLIAALVLQALGSGKRRR